MDLVVQGMLMYFLCIFLERKAWCILFDVLLYLDGAHIFGIHGNQSNLPNLGRGGGVYRAVGRLLKRGWAGRFITVILEYVYNRFPPKICLKFNNNYILVSMETRNWPHLQFISTSQSHKSLLRK